jgi:PKD repeat protein
MTISSRVSTIALAAMLPLAACSREEPAPPVPAAAVKPVAPPAGADADAKPVAADPKMMENPTAQEPGFLTAFADSNESVGPAPFTVKLNVEVVDNTGTPPYTFIWDFGDATEFSTEKSPTHVFKIPGSFRASVIIRDSKGEVDQDYIDVAVSDPNLPTGLTTEQLMQQVPLEEIMRQAAKEQAAKGGDGTPPPAAESEQ